MIAEVKGARLLQGFRGRAPAVLEALADTLVRVRSSPCTWKDIWQSWNQRPDAPGRASDADMVQWRHEPQGDGVTTYTFRIVVEPDEDRWRAYAPALEAQGAATWGYTREEALAGIREVLEMIVGELTEEGRSVPADVAVSKEPLVAVTVRRTSRGERSAPSRRAKSSVPSSATASRSTTSADRTRTTVTRTVAE